MANIKSSIRRIGVTERQTLRNKMVKSELKTYIKKFNQAIEEGNYEEAKALFPVIDKKLKMAASKNVIHKKNADRKLSNMHRKLNFLAQKA